MRKAPIFLSLAGLVGLGTSLGFAEPALNCSVGYSQCTSGALQCQAQLQECQDGPAIPDPKGNKPGEPLSQQHPGHPLPPLNEEYSSKPKMVNGQVAKNAKGETIMVASNGVEWAWNGKYNTYVSPQSKPGNVIIYNIPQGDPYAPYAKVDGQSIKVSSPQYAAAITAAAAKEKADQAQKQAAAAQQKKDYIDNAKKPGGILQRGGTTVTKEDVDVPSRGSKPTGSSSTANKSSAAPKPVAATSSTAKKPVVAAPAAPPSKATVTTVRNQVTGHQGSAAYHAQ